MDKFKFNFDLIAYLPSILGITITEIARRCQINQPTLRLYAERKRIVPVQTVIAICNTLRMPTRYFFYESSAPVTPNRERAIIKSNQWQPVWWDKQAVELTFGDSEGKIYWKDVADAMGVTSQKPRGRFALRTRFPVTDLLRVCNAFDLSPHTFLIDHNPMPGKPSKSQHTSSSKYVSSGSAAQSHDPLLADIANLHKKIDSLNATVEDLTAKYEALLKSHKALSHRVQVNIENFNDSHLSIAAEPTMPYGVE